MEVSPDRQPNAAGGKLLIDTLDSARCLGDNPRKEKTFARMGHDAGRGPPPIPLE